MSELESELELKRLIRSVSPLMAILTRDSGGRYDPFILERNSYSSTSRSCGCHGGIDYLGILALFTLGLLLYYIISIVTSTTTGGRRKKRYTEEDDDLGRLRYISLLLT